MDQLEGRVFGWYKCTNCDISGVRLWREYQYFSPSKSLFCAACAEAQQRLSHEEGWQSEFGQGAGLDIGWYVPAVPDLKEGGYWGYLSIPEAAYTWWEDLPVQVVNQDGC